MPILDWDKSLDPVWELYFHVVLRRCNPSDFFPFVDSACAFSEDCIILHCCHLCQFSFIPPRPFEILINFFMIVLYCSSFWHTFLLFLKHFPPDDITESGPNSSDIFRILTESASQRNLTQLSTISITNSEPKSQKNKKRHNFNIPEIT